jgi:protein-L-isoaspartate(D-aspartate) O-methyltransferase
MLNVEFARRQMIDQQVRAWEVLDERVLDAMSLVRREAFVPVAHRDLAFADMAVPLPHGQAMLPPKLEGRILQALAILPGDRALEIGTGSGHFAACLGRLAASVRSVEIIPELARTANERLFEQAAHNVTVEVGDGMRLAGPDGSLPAGGFEVIALSGSLPVYDARFERLLAEGGRLFAIVGSGPMMEARLITRVGPEEWLHESLFETAAPPLLHAPEAPRFVF